MLNKIMGRELPPYQMPQENYLFVKGKNDLWSWLFTLDHKRIALLYLISITFFFLIGGLAATIIRLELITPQGDLVSSDTYNRIFSLHGIIMIFFFLIPAIPSVIGNFIIPLMIGAKDLAFPRLNLFSWYLFMLGGIIVCYSMIKGGVDTGWTFYTPYSTSFSNTHVFSAAVGIFISGFSSILTALNFIVTIHQLRAPGQSWFRLPLFLWSMYATSLTIILGTPVIAMTILLVAFERFFTVGIFDPQLGGDPILFQHLFWFYSHPAVYIMVLPAMGTISEVITTFSQKEIFGYRFVALSSLAIAVLGFLVWGHHMFVSGQAPFAGAVFSFLSFLVAIPSAIKVFNWTATLHKGTIHLHTPMMYALGFIGLFTIGGLTGLFLAALNIDVHVHDTYFIVAHFHYIMVGGSVMAYLAAIHYWWPKMTGRLYHEHWGKFSAAMIFFGFNFTFFPQFILGYLGMPRRYHQYTEEFQVLNVLSSFGTILLAVGYIFPLIYLLYSLRYGRVAGPNPWRSTGLEWKTPSPPPEHNFHSRPLIKGEPYDYHGEETIYE